MRKRTNRKHKREFVSPRGKMALMRFQNRSHVLEAIRNCRRDLALALHYAETADDRGQRIYARNKVEYIQNKLDDLVEFTTY